MPMDENKSRQSPGMTDPQSGSSRAIFSLQEQEEVNKRKKKMRNVQSIEFI